MLFTKERNSPGALRDFRRAGFCLSNSGRPSGSLRHSGKTRRQVLLIVVGRKKPLTFMSILFDDE
jgi:hypothetical protein